MTLVHSQQSLLRILASAYANFQTNSRAFLNSGNWRAWPTDHKYHIFKDSLRSSTVRRGHRTFEKSEKERFFQSLNTPISAAKFPNCELFTNWFRWNFAETFLGSKQSKISTQFFIICLGLKMFGFWPQMTLNTPSDHNPKLAKKNLHRVLSFDLSYPKLWLVNYVTRYLKNKPKPEVAHKTVSRTYFEKVYWYVLFFWLKEPLCEVSA